MKIKMILAATVTLISILFFVIPVNASDNTQFDSFLYNIDSRMGHGTKDKGTSVFTQTYTMNITTAKALPDSDITSEINGGDTPDIIQGYEDWFNNHAN